MNKNQFPLSWDGNRVRQVIDHYESQTEDEATAEDEASFIKNSEALMEIPLELVPLVRELIAKYHRGGKAA